MTHQEYWNDDSLAASVSLKSSERTTGYLYLHHGAGGVAYATCTKEISCQDIWPLSNVNHCRIRGVLNGNWVILFFICSHGSIDRFNNIQYDMDEAALLRHPGELHPGIP